MVFIFSRLEDLTTVSIIQWLIAQGKDFFRLNTTADLDKTGFLYHTSAGLPMPGGTWSSNITSFFFYGGGVLVPPLDSGHSDLDEQAAAHMADEARALLTHELNKYKALTTFGLSPFSPTKVNKLDVLQKARNAGLEVPQTAVISSRAQLRTIKKAWGRIINKSIDEGIRLQTKAFMVGGQRTEEITDQHIEQLEERFFPSLFQKLIEKQYELRVFFFNAKVKSIAIFSQSADVSRIDGRTLNVEAPTRMVPYELPGPVKHKLILLMNDLGLNYGSIDLIIGTDDICYFLEVNPYGQLGFLSTAGNYHLEKQIAEFLI